MVLYAHPWSSALDISLLCFSIMHFSLEGLLALQINLYCKICWIYAFYYWTQNWDLCL